MRDFLFGQLLFTVSVQTRTISVLDIDLTQNTCHLRYYNDLQNGWVQNVMKKLSYNLWNEGQICLHLTETEIMNKKSTLLVGRLTMTSCLRGKLPESHSLKIFLAVQTQNTKRNMENPKRNLINQDRIGYLAQSRKWIAFFGSIRRFCVFQIDMKVCCNGCLSPDYNSCEFLFQKERSPFKD